MTTFTRFEELDDEDFFVKFVKEYYTTEWANVTALANGTISVEDARIKLAYDTYKLSLQQYAVGLQSANPDHYKRAGALLHALYMTRPISAISWDENSEYARSFDNVGVSYGDHEHWDNLMTWCELYADRAMAFDIAFRCCHTYEAAEKAYDRDFLNNICYYMAENTSIAVGSFTMILKAYMV